MAEEGATFAHPEALVEHIDKGLEYARSVERLEGELG